MRKSSVSFLALIAGAALALTALPPVASAVDTNTPTRGEPAQSSSQSAKPAKASKKKSKKEKKSEQQFIDGYRAAHALIYKRHAYAAGIDKLKSLGKDDNPDVANLIGYSSRKLGRYEDSEDLVRAGAGRRSEPQPHLVLLRHVARRAGQPAQGARASDQSGLALRHHVPRLHRAEGRDRGHPHVLMRFDVESVSTAGPRARPLLLLSPSQRD